MNKTRRSQTEQWGRWAKGGWGKDRRQEDGCKTNSGKERGMRGLPETQIQCSCGWVVGFPSGRCGTVLSVHTWSLSGSGRGRGQNCWYEKCS